MVTLPEGMTANPSLAEGLGVCREADLAAETPTPTRRGLPGRPPRSAPSKSKRRCSTDAILKGSLFVAEPYQNPFGSLLALYMVDQGPRAGDRRQARRQGRAPIPETGQLDHHLRRPAPAALLRLPRALPRGRPQPARHPAHLRHPQPSRPSSPPGPSPAPPSQPPRPSRSPGARRRPLPPGRPPPFEPGLRRRHRSTTTPAPTRPSHAPHPPRRRPGHDPLRRHPAARGGRQAGRGRANAPRPRSPPPRRRPATGAARRPSCPAASQIGSILAGAGVGSELTYVARHDLPRRPLRRRAALGGGDHPRRGRALRRRHRRRPARRFDIDPAPPRSTSTAPAQTRSPTSSPGSPCAVRDIRVYVDRPELHPQPDHLRADADQGPTLGRGRSIPSARLDDAPVAALRPLPGRQLRLARASSRSLELTLKGGTKRGAHPALAPSSSPGPATPTCELVRSACRARPSSTRPTSARSAPASSSPPTIAPRARSTARSRAFTPLLDEPLKGPVYLRSSDNKLPDLVFDLHGLVDFEAVAAIDSDQAAASGPPSPTSPTPRSPKSWSTCRAPRRA